MYVLPGQIGRLRRYIVLLFYHLNQIKSWIVPLLIVDCQRRLAIDAETRIIGILETG